MAADKGLLVGVLSDTHGYLYPSVKAELVGVDHIIHAGDVGSAEVLAELRLIAPVTVVRGNCDRDVWADDLPAQAELELGGIRFLVGHIRKRLMDGYDAESIADRYDVVVSGHTHRPALEEWEGVLDLNPGSAGPSRFGCPCTLARLRVGVGRNGAAVRAKIVYVDGE
ncbi:MAG: metallophosphoesterase family protein [Thermoleophilia bacterium]|jgi:putative phosphoesterase